jgi:hypothetical protein
VITLILYYEWRRVFFCREIRITSTTALVKNLGTPMMMMVMVMMMVFLWTSLLSIRGVLQLRLAFSTTFDAVIITRFCPTSHQEFINLLDAISVITGSIAIMWMRGVIIVIFLFLISYIAYTIKVSIIIMNIEKLILTDLRLNFAIVLLSVIFIHPCVL